MDKIWNGATLEMPAMRWI